MSTPPSEGEAALRDRSPQALWETALGQLELQVTRPNFDTWLRNTAGLEMEDGRLIVGVPSDFCVEWLRSRMSGIVDRTVSRLHGSDLSTTFQVLGAPAMPDRQDAAAATSAPEQPRPELDPRLTFESFSAVKGNRLAYRAARRAATGETGYNPLVLYGAPGLGKTHLLHAIGHKATEAGKRVVALTGEAFVDRYGNAVRFGRPHIFRELFANCDLLLLDDLRFLATRSASQEQFFHIFNSLHSNGCLVVVTADAALDTIDGLTDRLLSRLSAGLALELSPLSPEDRSQILLLKAAKLKRPLPKTVLDTIAEQPYQTVRALEGAINRAAAFADLSDAPLSTADIEQALHPLQPVNSEPTQQQIIDTVCLHFNVSQQQIVSVSRARDITYARHIAMYLLRHHGSRPLTEIGKLLGGRDHSTVLHACRRIEREHAALPQTRADIDSLESALRDRTVA
ncbi:MAG: chromosomal replication initiator protein DnaA [Chloroflexi bacterium]|nr:chromosomal replication initiator protein DnaA [Chloroflexota bacterium]